MAKVTGLAFPLSTAAARHRFLVRFANLERMESGMDVMRKNDVYYISSS